MSGNLPSPFLPDHLDNALAPGADFLIERHRPRAIPGPFHHHLSVEVNWLDRGEMIYAFGESDVALHAGRPLVFWGAAPHTVQRLQGAGQITNLYLPASSLVDAGLPAEFLGAILRGGVIRGDSDALDSIWLDRLWDERKSVKLRSLHGDEIRARLMRMALTGWRVVAGPAEAPDAGRKQVRAVAAMLRCMAERHAGPLSVAEIAASAGLSPGHATRVFRRVMGRPIKGWLTATRLAHARALIVSGQGKVATAAMDAGFGSLSTFYAAWAEVYGGAPGDVMSHTPR